MHVFHKADDDYEGRPHPTYKEHRNQGMNHNSEDKFHYKSVLRTGCLRGIFGYKVTNTERMLDFTRCPQDRN